MGDTVGSGIALSLERTRGADNRRVARNWSGDGKDVSQGRGARGLQLSGWQRQQAEKLVAECGGEDFCRAVKQELATADDGRCAGEGCGAAFGRLDCLVVNHGVWPPHDAPISEMTDDSGVRPGH